MLHCTEHGMYMSREIVFINEIRWYIIFYKVYGLVSLQRTVSFSVETEYHWIMEPTVTPLSLMMPSPLAFLQSALTHHAELLALLLLRLTRSGDELSPRTLQVLLCEGKAFSHSRGREAIVGTT